MICFIKVMRILSFFDRTKSGKILLTLLTDAINKRRVFKLNFVNIREGGNKNERKQWPTRNEIIQLFDDYATFASETKHEAI